MGSARANRAATGTPSPLPSDAEPSAAWADLIAAEFAKPQFMTTTSGPGNEPGTRIYTLEFTFVGDVGERAEAARAARDALEDAFRAAGRAINGPAT